MDFSKNIKIILNFFSFLKFYWKINLPKFYLIEQYYPVSAFFVLIFKKSGYDN